MRHVQSNFLICQFYDKILYVVILCTDGDWEKVGDNVVVDQDFRREMLQFKGKVATNEEKENYITVHFRNKNKRFHKQFSQGGIDLKITPSKFLYFVRGCTLGPQSKDHPIGQLKEEDDVVWSVLYVYEEKRIRVVCNGVELLNFLLSDNPAICPTAGYVNFKATGDNIS